MAWNPKHLKDWRARMAMTQVEAAEALGRSRSMISHYEMAIYPIPTAIELACQQLEAQRKEARSA